MKLSARNRIKGKIVDVKKGATTAHVKIDVGGGQIITSAITNESVDELGLAASQRGGAKANPRQAEPAEVAELLRSVW